MAYGKKTYRSRSRTKKYGKKYGRKRYSKKRFQKNSINQLTMRAPLAARLLRVKLPWIKTFNSIIVTSASQSYAFQGNGIIPYTLLGQTGANIPSNGDILPAGETEYSNFYDRYYINGSSIKVEAVNTAATSSAVLVRAVLLAIPFTSSVMTSTNDDWTNQKTQLDAYTYEQLLAWPYAKWRMLGSNTGGASRLTFKMFRKTKHMSGIKDLRDNQEFCGHLTDGNSEMITTENVINPYNGFMYYLRFFQNGSATSATLDITVKMSLYCTMTNREFNPTKIITLA